MTYAVFGAVAAIVFFAVVFMQLSEVFPTVRRMTPLVNGIVFILFLIYGCKTLVDD